MPSVPVKSAEQQAAAIVLSGRELLVRQRTQLVNAVRGHAAEFGVVAAKGTSHPPALIEAVATGEAVPEAAKETLAFLGAQVAQLDGQIEERLLAAPPPPAFAAALAAAGAESLHVGRVVVATWEAHEARVSAVIRDLRLEARLVRNEGALMVLLRGVDKRSGTLVAPRELGVAPTDCVGVGDAENDLDLLASCSLVERTFA